MEETELEKSKRTFYDNAGCMCLIIAICVLLLKTVALIRAAPVIIGKAVNVI
jgi:hypothetical protein